MIRFVIRESSKFSKVVDFDIKPYKDLRSLSWFLLRQNVEYIRWTSSKSFSVAETFWTEVSIAVPYNFSSIMFCLIMLTIEFSLSLSRRFVFGLPTASPCFELVCFVNPPFDLQIFSQKEQGKTFLPSISCIASSNSLSNTLSPVSTRSTAIFKW